MLPKFVIVQKRSKGASMQLINPFPAAELFVCYKFQGTSMSFKFGTNIVWVSNSLDPDEMPSYSIGISSKYKLFVYGI